MILLLVNLRGGLGIRNLRLVKVSLMANNVFNLLNVKQTFWVDIFIHKYGSINFWSHSVPPPKCSGFCRGLFWAANVIKPHLWLKVVNPTNTSSWWDPWVFETPLVVKPTFLNMNVYGNQLQFSGIMEQGCWSASVLVQIFGSLPSSPVLSHGNINPNVPSHWVWYPKTNKNNILAVIMASLMIKGSLITLGLGGGIFGSCL